MIARVFILALVMTLPGCVLHDRFRYVQKQDACFASPPDPVPGVPNESRPFPSVDCRTSLYKTAFIEFDQQGQHIDAAQAEKAVQLIESEKRRLTNKKIITLVYVHGWKNNADQAAPGRKAKDVERFSSALAELGERARQANSTTPVPIVGVYIAWKGRSLNGPSWFTWLSYWSRRNTGNRVGGDALTAVLNQVIDTSVPDRDDPSRVVFVGHSFGARVLEHAIENGVRLYDPAQVSPQPVRPRVDLVFYVNAAADARLSLGRVRQLQQQPIEVRHPNYDPAKCKSPQPGDRICMAYPLLVAITSRGDTATKYIQPIANTINLDDKSVPVPAVPAGAYLDDVPSDRRLKRSAPGHLKFLNSHDVTEITCPRHANEGPACAADDASCAFAFRTRGDCDACFKASKRQLAAQKKPFNETAFWIADIDKRVIKDHGDIWNLSTLSMLGELIAPRGFFEPGGRPLEIRLANE